MARATVAGAFLAFAALALVVGSPARGAAPRGFAPVSLTAVGEDDFWVLGTVPCRAGRCTAIVRTMDGGRLFARVAAPPVRVANTDTGGVLRFADRLDGFVLVTGVGGSFWTTHDGGATWHRVALGTVLAFATGRGKDSLLVGIGSSPTQTLLRTTDGGARWHAVSIR